MALADEEIAAARAHLAERVRALEGAKMEAQIMVGRLLDAFVITKSGRIFVADLPRPSLEDAYNLLQEARALLAPSPDAAPEGEREERTPE